MLTQNQIKEIREHLEKAQNPLFFFDNDQDGLCSFLLLQRYLERGKGFPIKSAPLKKDYFRKINELNPDYVFILDVPDVSKEFFDEIEKINLPVVWIDHHIYDTSKIPKFVNYYNPFSKKSQLSSTTDLCYQITKRKEDLWLAIVGSISDKFVPSYYSDFQKDYPELVIDSDEAFEIVYESEIGKVAQLLGGGLKDRTTNVIKMIKFLMKAKGPFDVLQEVPGNREMHEKFNELSKKYEKFMAKAKSEVDSDKLVFFEYSGDTSMSSELSNRLSHLFSGRFIFVAYIKEGYVNVSARGKGVKKILEKALEDLENAQGGGHEDAAGARIMKQDLEKFRKKVKEQFLSHPSFNKFK